MPSGTDVRDGTSRSLGAATHRFRNGFTCELSPDEVSGEGIAGSPPVYHPPAPRFRKGFTGELSPDEVSGEGIAGSRRVDHARDGRYGEVKDALMRHDADRFGSSLDHHDLIA